MLITNETVAEKFYWLEAPFIYRVHESPDQEKISELNKFLYNFGYKIKGSKDSVYKFPVYSSQTLNYGLLGYYKKFLFCRYFPTKLLQVL